MRIKLDENLGTRGAEFLRQQGHEVATVREQSMCAWNDRAVIDACRRERRCLVTLDMDFGNPLVFRPSDYFGIAVLRLRPKPSREDVLEAAKTLAAALSSRSIEGKLWIVQRGRMREYQEDNPEKG